MPHWLLIGNSRWHWAVCQQGPGEALRFWSETPGAGEDRLLALPPHQLVAWAAVGVVPAHLAGLPEAGQLTAAEVPLAGMPPWLGVDRALAGWGAWRRSHGRAVLVADAGTALSLTRVDAAGRFRGGRLLAGAGLQLRALGQGTLALPVLEPAALAAGPGDDGWPAATDRAMAAGVVGGLAAALAAAARELEHLPVRLWLTGGDGALLAAQLQDSGQEWCLAPGLVLEALAVLRPAPDP